MKKLLLSAVILLSVNNIFSIDHYTLAETLDLFKEIGASQTPTKLADFLSDWPKQSTRIQE